MPIKYLKHIQIDKKQWDKCIQSAPNGLIYGMSWYLDRVCSEWDALILDNYAAVMPLPWNNRFLIKFIYHPWFAQQLGIFGEPTVIKTIDFIKEIPKKYLIHEISFNFMNVVESTKAQSRNNYILALNVNYDSLYSRFNQNTIRNIKKANKLGFSLTRNIVMNEFMKLMLLENDFLLDRKNRKIVNNLIEFLIKHSYAEFVGIKSENEELLGAVLFVRFNNRIVYLFSASSQQGKEFRVMFKIVDDIIKENCETSAILDFEGSMNEGIARFYKGFGSQSEIYYRLNKKILAF